MIIIEKRAGEEDYGTVKYVSGKYSRKRPAAARTNAAERDESEKKGLNTLKNAIKNLTVVAR